MKRKSIKIEYSEKQQSWTLLCYIYGELFSVNLCETAEEALELAQGWFSASFQGKRD